MESEVQTAEDRAQFSDTATIPLNLEVSPKTDSDIERLSKEIHGTKADVFAWALALLTLAVNVKNQGKRLAIVDSKGQIETDITF